MKAGGGLAGTVVLTRPEGAASPWADGLRAAGWAVVELPLMAFAPPRDGQALEAGRARWRACAASMWVSPQAVAAFAPEGLVLPPGSVHRFWAPGPGTARALLRAGVPPAQLDQPDASAAQFDSQALWAVVGAQVGPGFGLLVVRGEAENDHATGEEDSGAARAWLAARVRERGGEVLDCPAYRRVLPAWSEGQRRQAQSLQGSEAVWVFSSAQSLAHLAELLPEASWARTRALATHPRIGEAAQRLGFGTVRVCKPALADLRAALRALQAG